MPKIDTRYQQALEEDCNRMRQALNKIRLIASEPAEGEDNTAWFRLGMVCAQALRGLNVEPSRGQIAANRAAELPPRNSAGSAA